MRPWETETAKKIARTVRHGSKSVFAVLLVACVGVLILSQTDVAESAKIAEPAVAVRGDAVHLSGGRQTTSKLESGEGVRAQPSNNTESPGLSPNEFEASAAGERRPVATAWAAEVLKRALHKPAEWYAERFDISLGLARDIHRIALDERIDPDVAFGLVRTESSFRPRVVSWAGAVGLTQLLPSTANWIVPGTHRSELFDIETNLRVGFRYLRHLMEKYNGDQRLALLAYNRGPGTVDGILSRGGDPSNGYAAKVLSD